jgi:hypothetical protein
MMTYHTRRIRILTTPEFKVTIDQDKRGCLPKGKTAG